MKIRETSVYLGPNHYALFPVIRLRVELGELEDWPTVRLGSDFQDALLEALPGLRQHGCSYGEPGGFLRRMREDDGTWLGHVVEHVALEIQNEAGAQVSFGKTRSAGEDGVYDVVYEYEQEDVGREAGDLALTLVHALLPGSLRPEGAVPPDFDFPDERDAFIRFAQRRALGPSTAALVKRGPGAGHPASAAQSALPRPVRPRQVPAADPGHRHQRDPPHRGRDRLRQGGDQPDPRRPGPAGAPPDDGLRRGAGDPRRAPHRLPGRRQAPRTPTTDAASRSVSRRDEQVRVAFQKAREHERTAIVESFIPGLRPPHAGRERRADRRGQARAGPRRRRRGAAPSRSWSSGVNEDPAARHRPREGAHAPRVRPPGAAAPGAEGVRHGERAARRARSSTCARPATCRPAARRSTSPTSCTPTTARWPSAPPRPSGSTSPASTSSRPTSPAPTRRWAAPSARSTPRPGFRMHVAPSEGTPAGRRRPGDGHAVPAGHAQPDPHRGDHRHQRQDDDVPHARPHPQDDAARVGLTTTDGVYIDGQLHGGGRHDRARSRPAWSCATPRVDVAVLETARGGLLRARAWATGAATWARCLNVAADHLGLQRHRHPRGARGGEAHRRRGRPRGGGAQRRRSALPEDGRPHDGRARRATSR